MQFVPSEIDGNTMVIAIDGGLDATTSAQFTSDVLAMVDGGVDRLIIDCRGLTSLTSQGIGAILRLHSRAASRGGDVKLCAVPGLVMQVLTMMRMDRIFGVYPDVDRARLSFQASSGG